MICCTATYGYRMLSDTEADVIRRYTEKYQGIREIGFALDLSYKKVREILVANNIRVRKPGPGATYRKLVYGRRIA